MSQPTVYSVAFHSSPPLKLLIVRASEPTGRARRFIPDRKSSLGSIYRDMDCARSAGPRQGRAALTSRRHLTDLRYILLSHMSVPRFVPEHVLHKTVGALFTVLRYTFARNVSTAWDRATLAAEVFKNCPQGTVVISPPSSNDGG